MLNSFRLSLLAGFALVGWWILAPQTQHALQRNRRAAIANSYISCQINGQLALTISDTPTQSYFDSLVQAVKSSGAPVTYFVVTSYLRNNNALRASFISLVNSNSLTLGITYPTTTTSQSYADIQSTLVSESNYLQSLIGSYTLAVRFPAGSDSSTAIKAAADLGMYIIGYSIDTLLSNSTDPSPKVRQNFDLAVAGVAPSSGSFIVMHHDATDYAVSVVHDFVSYMGSKDYKWVSLSSCIGVDSISSSSAPATAEKEKDSAHSGSESSLTATWSFLVFLVAAILFSS